MFSTSYKENDKEVNVFVFATRGEQQAFVEGIEFVNSPAIKVLNKNFDGEVFEVEVIDT